MKQCNNEKNILIHRFVYACACDEVAFTTLHTFGVLYKYEHVTNNCCEFLIRRHEALGIASLNLKVRTSRNQKKKSFISARTCIFKRSHKKGTD